MRAVDTIFNDRTCYKFLNKTVEKGLLIQIYNLMKLGPTSGNACPLRIIFVQSDAEKEKLYKALMESNVAKVKSSPVVALFAYDMKFYEKMEKLYPTGKFLRDFFAAANDQTRETEALRNSSLQASYFMMIARSMGLDCGPMSGFDQNVVNDSFFKDTNYRVNFICNFGYKDGDNPYPRLPRLEFDEACKIV